jgi:hypothetical protein
MGKSETRLPVGLLLVLLILAVSQFVRAQGQEDHVGLPIDWSSRHIVFTNGASPEVAALQARDVRSWVNWAQRTAWMFPREPWDPFPPLPPITIPRRHMRVDWAMPLGTLGGMPLGETPAKYSFNVNSTPSCANDFVVYTIAATPGAGQANIVAFNNLYTGTSSTSCGALTQPTYMFAYALGTAGSSLSPTLSLNGTKVAFLESGNEGGASTPAYFDVVTWVSGQGTSATVPCVIAGAGTGCSGTTLTRLNFTNSGVSGCGTGTSDSDSSAYVDYASDSAYVGADNGMLYRIHPVFTGTPAVQFCITVNANKLLTSPVYDQVTNEVFVSDGHSLYAFKVGSSAFTLANSVTIASGSAVSTVPIILSPIVDSTNGFVYVFSSADSTNTNSVVAQVPIQSGGTLGTPATAAIGPAATVNTTYVLDGDFNNVYYSSGPTNANATLYACGTQTGAATLPSLYAISFQSNGTMNNPPVMSNNKNIYGGNTNAGSCSPLLDFFDGTNDRLFVGAGAPNATNGANLVTEWLVNTRITSNTASPTSTATNEWGGTSAFTVDNVSTEAQAASIYFGTQAKGTSGTAPACPSGQYCAIKLTQSALQ